MSFYDAIRVGASGAAGAFTVERSLRFNSGDSPYLAHTPPGAGSNQMTFSFWMKRGAIGTQQVIFSSGAVNARGHIYIYNDKLTVQPFNSSGANGYIELNRVFRDPSAWYHIVVTLNNAAYSNMASTINVYVNNVAATFTTHVSNTPTGGNRLNDAQAKRIGEFAPDSGSHFDGYLTEFNFIDGQVLTPSSFAETDSTTGQWNPIEYTGSYGTNGFYLNFSDNSGTTATTLGKDSSGNSNNWTPNNFSVSTGLGNDSFEDTPTKNFPTLNPNHAFLNGSSSTAENGNLQWNGQSNNQAGCPATMAFPKTGKWYWEVKLLSSNSNFSFGITPATYSNVINPVSPTGAIGYAAYGSKAVSGVETPNWAATFSSSDNIGAALDMDNNEIKFYKNNSLVGTISLVSGYEDIEYLAWIKGDTQTQLIQGAINFGGNGFVYTPPTGFKALNSANLSDPTILLPNKHFDILLWTGNNSTSDRSITGLNFQPDWAWTKTRTYGYHHALFDSVRGVINRLNSDQTFAENHTGGGYLASFDAPTSGNNDGGITWDYGTGNEWWNENPRNYLSWNWNAGDTDGKTYTVKVVSDSGNKYRFDNFGTSAVTLDLAEGGTYIFNMDDASNATHPFSIGTAANGTVYTSGITYFLDGVSKTYNEYTSGFSAASTRRLHITVPASAPVLYYWCSVHSGMGGQINTNSTLGSSNFDGTLQSTVKANTTAGFSIVTYTGNGSSGSTIGHGLGVTPNFCFMKRRDSTQNWLAATFDLQTARELNTSNPFLEGDYDAFFTSQPTSTTITMGNDDVNNKNGSTYVGYIFSEVAGYSKFGSYTGNGSSDGPFVFCGFTPRWILLKCTGASGNWVLIDTERPSGGNFVNYNTLSPNLSDAENSSGGVTNDILSNGFKLRGGTDRNINGQQHIFLAFAESPFKNARAR